MKDVLKLVVLFVSVSTLFSGHAIANETPDLEEIIKTCEAEAEGMADPETYIQQCIDDLSGQAQKAAE
ncbi:MAG: hypothetical protein OEY89_01780 [Gammaproteobacteria bacterium]|nr:hypothetical protein [Gammaproteobacteria bacterium]